MLTAGSSSIAMNAEMRPKVSNDLWMDLNQIVSMTRSNKSRWQKSERLILRRTSVDAVSDWNQLFDRLLNTTQASMENERLCLWLTCFLFTTDIVVQPNIITMYTNFFVL